MSTYTHGHHESVLRSHRWRTAENSAAYLLPFLGPDDRLLDVGAGPGTITVDLAERVAHVTATEIGEDEAALTRATVDERGVPNVDVRIADVHALPFDDDSFDVTHAHQVLQHIADPVQALRELARVTRPGGIIAVRDADFAGFAWWPQLPEMDRWLELYQAAARANGGEPNGGRRLLSWAREAGLTDISASSSTWCYSSADERMWWGNLWADRIRQSALAQQLEARPDTDLEELDRIAAAWREWSRAEDGWFSLLHGEIICRVP